MSYQRLRDLRIPVGELAAQLSSRLGYDGGNG
jgi:hypothetical protein